MGCPAAVPFAALVDYWFDGEGESLLEPHLFSCSHCSETLGWIARLADEIPGIVRQGGTMVVLTEAVLERLREHGVRVREYRVGPGGSVNCTIAPTDDLVVSHLAAPPLAGLNRLDLVVSTAGGVFRAADIPFDRTSGEIVVAQPTRRLRSLGHATEVAQLVAVDEGGERVLGQYTFNHSPFPAAP